MKNNRGTIESVSIEQLWMKHNINLVLHHDINFLTGVNGSGKTTVINLIVAVLTTDLQYLYRTKFKSISISIRPEGSTNPSSVMVEKKLSKDNIGEILIYTIFNSKKSVTFKVDSAIGRYYQRANRLPHHFNNNPRSIYKATQIQQLIDELINVSWLSVQRYDKVDFYRDDEADWSLVDDKLKSQSDDLVRHLSGLKTQVGELLNTFQRKIFLSLIFEEPRNFKIPDLISSTNFSQVQDTFKQIFSQLDLFSLAHTSAQNESINDVEATIDSQFRIVNAAKEHFLNNSHDVGQNELVLFYNTMLIEKIVVDWNEYLKSKDDIDKPKNSFLKVINEMSTRKEILINDRNEIEISTRQQDSVKIKDLSSGEKQLLIVLTEALLQNAKPYVYIADEPELSLHVDWQECLVTNIRAINPKAQIFFATHSPDIVGPYEEKMFDMEDITS